MEEKSIKIDTNSILKNFKKTENDEIDVTEGQIARAIVDLLNIAGVNAEMIYQDTDFSIHLQDYGIQACLDYMSFEEDPVSEFMRACMNFSDEINCSGKIRSWISYSNGECFLHMKEMTVEEEEKLEQEDELDKQGY